MKPSYTLVPSIFVLSILAVFNATAAPIINGDFQGPVGTNRVPAPWAIVNLTPDTLQAGGIPFGNGTAAPGIPASPNGGTFGGAQAELGVFSESFEQDIAGLIIGTAYRVIFHQANAGYIAQNAHRLDPGRWEVTFGAQPLQTPVLAWAGQNVQTWHEVTLNFGNAVAVSQTLRFRAVDVAGGTWRGTGMAVDGIRVEAVPVIVPEPATGLLVALGGSCALAVARTRRLRSPIPPRLPLSRRPGAAGEDEAGETGDES